MCAQTVQVVCEIYLFFFFFGICCVQGVLSMEQILNVGKIGIGTAVQL